MTPDRATQVTFPRVWNKRGVRAPATAVYVGRPTKWGNPFSHLPNTLAKFQVKTRDDAVDAYRSWVVTQPELLSSLEELRGRDLVCWCAPKRCHADVLLELSNA